MENIFLKLVSMSVAAGWGILAVMALRLVFRRAPKWTRCALWGIVAVRLICPFSFESALSLVPDTETVLPAGIQVSTPYSASPAASAELPTTDNISDPVLRESTPVPRNSANSLHALVSTGSIVWAIGLAALAGYGLFSYLRVRRQVAEAVQLRGNVYLCDAVQSPFILGLVRPHIYLPSDTETSQMDCILAHERAHLERRDHWWKLLGCLLLAVYWFHPLVWAAYILLCRDIELACDEKAVRNLNLNGRKEYSEALVACSMKQRLMICPLAFGEIGVKERVKTVLYYKKPAFWLSAAAIAACVIAAVCFLTNPRKNDTLAERIESEKEKLTEQIGTIISDAEAVRYSITDWELTVEQIEGDRADCFFGANWISIRTPEEDPMIRGMYDAVEGLTDETQKAYALETADGWLVEVQSWPEEEYLEHHIVVLREGQSLALYYPYVMDGKETLIPLQKYVEENWREDSEQRYQSGVDIITEALSTTFPDAADTFPDAADSGAMKANIGLPENFYVIPEAALKEGISHCYIKGIDKDFLILDDVEWITDSARAAEVGLDKDMPSGFAVYNETESETACYFAEDCGFTILDWHNGFVPEQLDRQAFLAAITERRSEYPDSLNVPFIIEIKDGEIINVTEQYVP